MKTQQPHTFFGRLGIFASLLIFAPLMMLSSCTKDQTEPIDPLDEQISSLNLQPLPSVPNPSGNPTTSAKVELGRLLFWDPIVGGQKDVACATCHHPDFGYSDGLDLPIGVNGSGLGPNRTENTGGLSLANPIERVPRNSPSVINTAYNGIISSSSFNPDNAPMFWDLRVKSLEGQCQKPPTSRSEMRGDAFAEEDAMDSVVARLAAIPQYVQLFTNVFGPGPITIKNYAAAVGAFERSIISDNSPYDRYVNGDLSALTSDQKKGLILFHGKAKCTMCHPGPMLSDFQLHCIGIPENSKSPTSPDGSVDNKFAFRTPSLRNLAITGPYMHNGIFTNVKDVVKYINDGVCENPYVVNLGLDPGMGSLDLTDQEINQIVAFLESLNDENFDKVIPSSVPSGLEVGGNIH